MPPRHHESSSYVKGKENDYEKIYTVAPHRFQPRSTALRRRQQLKRQRRIIFGLVGLVVVLLFGYFVWPRASLLSILSLEFWLQFFSVAQKPEAMDETGLAVICAWPVSSQYGPGSRFLYYGLLACCILVRKKEWLTNVCLAAALLLPAVAAIHGIFLAAFHVKGAVDMDIYGAFQFCSIGILTASLILRLLRPSFYYNFWRYILIWTGVLAAGLLSLMIEFSRIETFYCAQDDYDNLISFCSDYFSYDATACGLLCSVDEGPFSPLRAGLENNIVVIPAPDKFPSHTARLFAVLCSISAPYFLIYLWAVGLGRNFRLGDKDESNQESTGGASITTAQDLDTIFRRSLIGLNAHRNSIFGIIAVIILLLGEWNFFSTQVRYQTEPMSSLGQWIPIIGSGIAVLGTFMPRYSDAPSDVAADMDSLKEFKHYSKRQFHTPDSTASRLSSPDDRDESSKDDLEEKETGSIVISETPKAPRRQQSLFAVPTASISLSGYSKWASQKTKGTAASTAGSERGFYRVSGRKLPSVGQTLGSLEGNSDFGTESNKWSSDVELKSSSAVSLTRAHYGSGMTGIKIPPPPTSSRSRLEHTFVSHILAKALDESAEKLSKTPQKLNPARPGNVRQLWDQFMTFRKRPPEAGKTRITWQCKCGHTSYDDFKHFTQTGADDLRKAISGSETSSTTSSKTSLRSTGRTLSSGISSLFSSVSFKSSGNKDSDLPLHTRPSIQDPSNAEQAQPPPPPISNEDSIYLLLCYSEGRYATRLLQLDLVKLQAKSDIELFKLLYKHYNQMKGGLLASVSFRELTNIKFVHFEAHKSDLVDVRKQDDIPPPDNPEYRYIPVPPLLVPPVGERYMMHLFHNPSHADENSFCLNRFPKKLKERLLYNGNANPGWGLQFVEGWNMKKIWIMTFIIFGLGSLLMGVLWCVYHRSIQDAFTIASYMVAFATISFGTLQASLVM